MKPPPQLVVVSHVTKRGGPHMRDIRVDLQDRANMLQQQISAEHARLEERIAQLKREQTGKVADLKTELDSILKVIEMEQRRLGGPALVLGPQQQKPAEPAAGAHVTGVEGSLRAALDRIAKESPPTDLASRLRQAG